MEEPGHRVFWWQKQEKTIISINPANEIWFCASYFTIGVPIETPGGMKLTCLKYICVKSMSYCTIQSHTIFLQPMSVLLTQIHKWSIRTLSAIYGSSILLSDTCIYGFPMTKPQGGIFHTNVLDQHQSCLTHPVCWHASCLHNSYWIILISSCTGEQFVSNIIYEFLGLSVSLNQYMLKAILDFNFHFLKLLEVLAIYIFESPVLNVWCLSWVFNY